MVLLFSYSCSVVRTHLIALKYRCTLQASHMGRAIRNHVFLAAIAILGFAPSQAVMPPRVRFNSDGDDLTTTLSRHITTPGWLTYGKGNVAVNGNHIEKNYKTLVMDLKRLQDNLAFKKSDIKKSLTALASAFKLSAADAAEFVNLVSSRLALLCRHVNRALTKKPPPKWATRLVSSPDLPTSSSGEGQRQEQKAKKTCVERQAPSVDANRPRAKARDAEDTELEVTSESNDAHGDVSWTWSYGYNTEFRRSWRRKVTDDGEELGGKEWALPQLLPQSNKLDPPLAFWPDGSSWAVCELTSEGVEERTGPTKSVRRRQKVHFTGHTRCGKLVVVKRRGDRKPQVSLFVDSRQRCQVVLDEAEEAVAVKTLTSVAKQIIDGSVDLNHTAIYEARDEMLKREGITPVKPGAQAKAKKQSDQTSTQANAKQPMEDARQDSTRHPQHIMKKPASDGLRPPALRRPCASQSIAPPEKRVSFAGDIGMGNVKTQNQKTQAMDACAGNGLVHTQAAAEDATGEDSDDDCSDLWSSDDNESKQYRPPPLPGMGMFEAMRSCWRQTAS